MSSFHFKQFEINQPLSAMKVGSDGVLLGAWCSVPQLSVSAPKIVGKPHVTARILDVGTGTGLIAIMVAQRSLVSHIDAIEIDSDSCHDAIFNFRNSPWSDRLILHHISLQEFVAEGCYDRIVSNPPYFIDSLKSPSASRNSARHTDTLPYHDLIDRSLEMLTNDGSLSVILPLAESAVFEKQAVSKGLYCGRRLEVHSTPTSGVRRVAMEFYRHPRETELVSLTIESHLRHDYSDDYKSLTKDFYLKF